MQEVRLVPYCAAWQQQFEREKAQLLEAIGSVVKGIEHVGSTSIEGMCAKPIIDIVVGVNKIEEGLQCIAPLEAAGFHYVEKRDRPHVYFFRKGEWGQGTCHVHLCVMEGCEWQEKIAFRD